MFEWLSDRIGRFYCQLGEVTGIGATCHLLRICGKTILIDFGVAISRKGEFQIQGVPAGNFLIGTPIDLIIITHAHLDHFGAIARFTRHHPETKIIVSKSALAAIAYMLADSLHIMEGEISTASRLGISLGEPLFTEQDRLNFLSNPNLIAVDLPSWLDTEKVLGKSWAECRIGFPDSGHDIGAMMSFITDPLGRPYLVTGDVCSHDQIFIKGVMLPDKSFCGDFFDRPGLVMITEMTNGAKPMTETPEEILVQLGKKLKEVSAKNGLALIAAFSKNRCSKMALACIQLGYVPFVDGSGRTMMRIELGSEVVDQLLKSGKLIFANEGAGKENARIAKEQRAALFNGEMGFHPYIAPSGTLQGGHSVSAANIILSGKNNAVIFPGYLFPDSISKQIYDMTRGHTVVLDVWNNLRHRLVPTPVNVRCEVCHFDFTSHDKQERLVQGSVLAKPEILICHHGDEQAFTAYPEALLGRYAELNMPAPRIERGGHLKTIQF